MVSAPVILIKMIFRMRKIASPVSQMRNVLVERGKALVSGIWHTYRKSKASTAVTKATSPE